ncbi:hypothetical protein RJ641_025959 [Dillenia turbinata]|uniref:Uncharacterized protein n=1 Tax=Dillenia turbinata TaxID=194707 RepID=A0AAN8WAQ9_9MAGN
MDVEVVNPSKSSDTSIASNQSAKKLVHSGLVDKNSRSMPAKIDPPLDSIWFYTAAALRDRDFKEGESLKRLQSLKELFDLIVSCSASSSGLKSIALVSPVVFHAYNLLADVLKSELSDKKEKKLLRDVKSLVDSILGYFSVCCTSLKNLSEGSECVGLNVLWKDLISAWLNGDYEEGESLREFFPLSSDEICRGLCREGCNLGDFAGVVMVEVFLLRLCLNCSGRPQNLGLEKDLKVWAVGSISGFQSSYMFGTLLKIMLEPVLPVSSLLSSNEEVLLRKVLFDAVIMVEYSFLETSRLLRQSVELMKMIAMARLIVTNNAIELFRKDGDQKRAISYINAFSGSSLPSQIIDLISSHIGMEGKKNRPKGSSPRAFLDWVLNLEDRGIKLFEVISNYRANILWDSSGGDDERSVDMVDGKQLDADLLFFIDNKGEESDKSEDDMEEEKDIEEVENVDDSISNAFITAAQTMSSIETSLTRKCREGKSAEKMKRIKFAKYDLSENANAERENSVLVDDGSSSESDVENPSSDEDMDARSNNPP